MIDPAVKVAMALCILLAGTCAALMFRHASRLAAAPDAQPAAAAPGAEQLLIRHRAAPTGQTPTAANRNKAPGPDSITLSPSDDAHAVAVVAPSDSRESPPPLAESYPEPIHSASWGVSMNMLMPVTVPPSDGQRTHTVVDGDTLASLAKRYLGSAERAKEILAANRDVLSDPRLLPIGSELKIPPRTPPKKPAPPPRAPQ
jgi:nucleoid-associated protein YgaU